MSNNGHDNDAPNGDAVAGYISAATAEELSAFCANNIDTAKKQLGTILAVSTARTVANSLEPYNHLTTHLGNARSLAGLYANVHPDRNTRQTAEKCEQDVGNFTTELSLNRPLYDAINAVDVAQADALTRRFVEHTLRDFRRAGVDKSDDTRARLQKINDELVRLGQDFDKNIRNDVRSIRATPEQLEGLPQDFIDAHKPGPDGRIEITTDYPDFIPFRTYAKNADARTTLYRQYTSRGFPANDRALHQILALRQEKAKLLGYATFADYITEDKMVKSGDAVAKFIERLAKVSQERAKKDLAAMLARKQKDVPGAKDLGQDEALYYEELVRRETFAFNSQDVRPYFEFSRVRDGLLAVTGKLFGVSYRPASDDKVWHKDVSVYDVWQGDQNVGRIYLDLHPREGKYKHAAQFTLVSGVTDVTDASRPGGAGPRAFAPAARSSTDAQLPAGVLVCNFPNPRTTSPALMEHDEVVTLFHEFGHLMHHILGGRQHWADFSGVATEWDFVEAPSQMLEEWAWDRQTLQMFAKHYQTETPIPDELVARMRRASEFGKGTTVRHQLFYAALSLAIHTLKDPNAINFDELSQKVQKQYSMFSFVPGTHFFASFGHLNGYSAMYYTYQWSLVIAKDLFSAFRKAGISDPETAHRYRDRVLAAGGSKDAALLVREFLGRDYSFDSYKTWLNQD